MKSPVMTAPADISATAKITPVTTRRRRLPERLLFGLIGLAIILPAWEIIARLGLVKSVLISSPSAIAVAAWEVFSTGEIWPHIGASAQSFAIGLGLAIAIGIPIGMLMGLFRPLEQLLYPLIYGIYSTPKVAIIPLIIVIAGLGLAQQATVVFLSCVFTLIIATTQGVQAADARHIEVARYFGASRWLRLRSVVLPTTVPFIATGLRIATGRALVGIVVAEFIASNVGIGYFISFNGAFLKTDRMFVGLLLLGVLGMVMGELVRRFEQSFERWRPVALN